MTAELIDIARVRRDRADRGLFTREEIAAQRARLAALRRIAKAAVIAIDDEAASLDLIEAALDRQETREGTS